MLSDDAPNDAVTPGALRADLVLEGGGVLGVAHVGALSVLAEQGYTFARIAGTSVGSIVGAFLAAGMPVQRVAEVMRSVDYSIFTDKSPFDRVPVAGPLWSVLRDNGIYEGDAIHDFVARILKDECGVETFADLALDDASLPPEQRYALVVTATDTTRGELVRFPWDYQRLYGLDPRTQRVADAVRASISIPFFFEPVVLIDSEGAEYTLVDGGVLSNFPIDLLDRTDAAPPRHPTFGIKLLPRLPMEAAQLFPLLGLVRYGPVKLLSDLVMTTLVGRDQARLSLPWVAARTIAVDTGSVNPVDFGIGDREIDSLFAAGRRAAQAFLATWDWPAYVNQFRSH